MKIRDLDTNTQLSSVGIVLTMSEAKELQDGLGELAGKTRESHVHVSSSDPQTELTLSIEEAEVHPPGEG